VIVPKYAVLLVDLQRDFLDRGRGRMPVGASGAKAVLRVANDVLSQRTLVGALPILVMNQFPSTARLANFFRKGAAIIGSAGAELDGRLERSGSEQVFTKALPSAFSNPELERYLRANGVQDLYVLGVFAEGCVRSTALEAVKRGYTVHVIADAVASNAAWKKTFALWAMARAGAEILPSVVSPGAATERPTTASLTSNFLGAEASIRMKKVCIVGASGKLGQYMVRHALARGYEVVGVCRKSSVGKLDTPSSRPTSCAAWTLRCSWWRPSRATS
jgi:nicotinamidase-related amidase